MESQDSLEVSAKTVEEATRLALAKLGLQPEEAEITVLHKGRTGILGLGAEEARVSVRRRAKPQEEPREEEGGDLTATAKEILDGLLGVMGITARVEPAAALPQGLTSGAKIVALDVRGEDLGALIGRQGQTLAALQYVVNLILSHRSKSRLPVMVDVEGYKRRRYEALESLARRMAEQVKSTGQAVSLEPMPANERRIVHLALANDPQVTTQSLGTGETRKVQITPKSKKSGGSAPP